MIKEYQQKLVGDLKELVKSFKAANDRSELNRLYSKAKQKATDFYETEMDKLFVGNSFIDYPILEEHNQKNRSAAWAILKSLKIPGADEVSFDKTKTKRFHAHIDSSYRRYKQMNRENRERSEKRPQTSVHPSTSGNPKHIGEASRSLSLARDLYHKEMKKVQADKKYLPDLQFNEKDKEIRKKCFKRVSYKF